MKTFFATVSFVFCAVAWANAQDSLRTTYINLAFEKIEAQGINTSQPLLFSYFFFDSNKNKLENLKNDLLKDNYHFGKLEQTKNQQYVLQVNKTEIHSRTSLAEREKKLAEMAKISGIDLYDGWEVEIYQSPSAKNRKDSLEKSFNGKTAAEIYQIANNFYYSDAYGQAIIAYQKCIDQNFMTETCCLRQGFSIIETGNISAGISKLEEAVKINPSLTKAYYNLACTYYEIGENQKAIDNYLKASELAPSDDRNFYGMAAAQQQIGQMNEAKLNCEKALKLNPKNKKARELQKLLNKSNKQTGN